MADPPQLDWDDLRYFLLAAQAGTLAGAARAGGVQHTTIGRRLSALEHALGAPLFLRGPEGLTLTPVGEELLPLAQKAESEMMAVREFVATRRNRVRLALPSGLVALFANDLVRLAQEHPDITLETVSAGRLADLQRGDADLALRVGSIHDEELVARAIGEVGLSLYASPGYLQDHPAPADVSDLSGHQVLAFGADLAALPPARWLQARMGRATVVLRTNEMATMLEAAAAGAGIALLPCMLADGDARLVRLTPDVPVTRSLSLVYRREQKGSRAVRTVAGFLVDALRAHGARIGGARTAG